MFIGICYVYDTYLSELLHQNLTHYLTPDYCYFKYENILQITRWPSSSLVTIFPNTVHNSTVLRPCFRQPEKKNAATSGVLALALRISGEGNSPQVSHKSPPPRATGLGLLHLAAGGDAAAKEVAVAMNESLALGTFAARNSAPPAPSSESSRVVSCALAFEKS